MPKIEINQLVTKVSSSIKARDLSSKGEFPVYGAQGIAGYSGSFQTAVSSIAIIKDGAGVGRVQIIPPNSSVIGTLQLLVPKNDVDVSYLFYLFSSMDLGKSFSGATIPHIYFKDYGKNYVNDNSFTLQKEIGVTLDLISCAIKSTKQYICSLNELIKSRFIEMYGNKIYSVNYICKFKDISDIIIGLAYSPSNIVNEGTKGTIVLRSGNIQNGSLQIVNDVVRVANIKINDNKLVRDNDILMCSRNGSPRLVGKTCLITNPTEKISFGAFMTVIRTPFPYIVNTYMNLPYFREQLTKTQTASVNQITNGMLKDLQIFQPTELDESLFKTFVNKVDKLKFVWLLNVFIKEVKTMKLISTINCYTKQSTKL